jgi:transposase-like protein
LLSPAELIIQKLAEVQSDPRWRRHRRVVVDEKQIKIDGDKKCLYAAIDTDSKLLLGMDVFNGRGTDPAVLTRT